jgi:hypothetical protein
LEDRLMKRQIFVQSELLADIAILEVEHNATQRELREALLGLVEKTEEPLIIFLEDEDDEEAFGVIVEIPEELRVHLHRLRSIDVTVRYAGNDVRRSFRPSATIARVKGWATHELRITPSDAAELMLQIAGTDARPDPDIHIGSLVRAPAHKVIFDLVPSPRVNGAGRGRG